MEEAMKLVNQTIQSGRSYAKRSLLYEAAYRYGQAAAMIKMIYLLHGEEVLKLNSFAQQALTALGQKLETLSVSLSHSAGNGHHKMSGASAPASSKESLHRVLAMLDEDIHGPI